MKFFAVFFLFCLASAAPFLQKRANVTAPTNDTFYDQPKNLSSYSVGSIINYRKVANPFNTLIVAGLVDSVYEFQVSSEDSHGKPMAIITTLFVPARANSQKLLSYHIAEDAAFIDCAPSYTLQIDSSTPNSADEIMIQASINQGWYVAVPDYEGPNSAFGAAILAGQSALNSVRAVLKSGNFTGLQSNAKVAYWGYSGGSIPTGWAALLTETYAPDLEKNNVGFALGGIVADIHDIAAKRMGTEFASLIVTAINGLTTEYSDLKKYVDENVFSNVSSIFTKPLTDCSVVTLFLLAYATWNKYFKSGDSVLSNPVVLNITTENSMVNSTLVPTSPLYFYNTVLDEVVPPQGAQDFYDLLCKKGANITFKQDMVGEHIIESYIGAGDAFSWLQDRFAGIQTYGCSKDVTISKALNQAGDSGLGSVFTQALTDNYIANVVNAFMPSN